MALVPVGIIFSSAGPIHFTVPVLSKLSSSYSKLFVQKVASGYRISYARLTGFGFFGVIDRGIFCQSLFVLVLIFVDSGVTNAFLYTPLWRRWSIFEILRALWICWLAPLCLNIMLHLVGTRVYFFCVVRALYYIQGAACISYHVLWLWPILVLGYLGSGFCPTQLARQVTRGLVLYSIPTWLSFDHPSRPLLLCQIPALFFIGAYPRPFISRTLTCLLFLILHGLFYCPLVSIFDFLFWNTLSCAISPKHITLTYFLTSNRSSLRCTKQLTLFLISLYMWFGRRAAPNLWIMTAPSFVTSGVTLRSLNGSLW